MIRRPPRSTLFPYTTALPILKIKARAYLIEGANPRHEHEWALWQEVKLPDDKILVPGVVSQDRKSTRLNSSHMSISYAVFCLKKKKNKKTQNATQDISVTVTS